MPNGTQTFALTAGRINKFKGQILKHAVPQECLSRQGRQVELPKNSSDTYVSRRFLPFGATATSATTQNTFFPTANGDRGAVVVQAHIVQEGVTPLPESIVPMDVTTVIVQYSCLYSFTNKTYDLYEDDIPTEMIRQVGERVTLVNELIVWGVLRACTNQFFGGTGTTVLTTNGGLTLGLIRKISKSLQANHSTPVNTMLKASSDFNTSPVSRGYAFYVHTDAEPDIRDLPGFIPAEQYASGKPQEFEIGAVERMRFFTSRIFLRCRTVGPRSARPACSARPVSASTCTPSLWSHKMRGANWRFVARLPWIRPTWPLVRRRNPIPTDRGDMPVPCGTRRPPLRTTAGWQWDLRA